MNVIELNYQSRYLSLGITSCSWIDCKNKNKHDILKEHGEFTGTTGETKTKTLNLAARENQRIVRRDKEKELQQNLQVFQKIFEEIHKIKHKV